MSDTNNAQNTAAQTGACTNGAVNSIAKLATRLGFDPTKPNKITSSVFGEALKEIQAENAVKAKEAAKKKITEAMALCTEFAKAEGEFGKVKDKFEKSVKGYINDIERLTNGQDEAPAPTATEETK